MIEETMYHVAITYDDNRKYFYELPQNIVDAIFDALWEREPIKYVSYFEDIISLHGVRHIKYKEIEEEKDRGEGEGYL